MTKHLLEGEHAVVTGGAGGIGTAIADALSGLGAGLTLMGRDGGRLLERAAELTQRHGTRVRVATVDVTDDESVRRAFDVARATLGAVTILVANAGAVETAPFVKTNAALWRRMIDVNLTGVFLCCREVIAPMVAAGKGRVVVVASTASLEGQAYVSAYAAAKHGALGLVRSIAVETGGTGVTVNAVCPGYTDTDLVARSARVTAERTGKTVDEVREIYAAMNPGKRLVRPDEVAAVVARLCRPGADAPTGQAIVIDGSEES